MSDRNKPPAWIRNLLFIAVAAMEVGVISIIPYWNYRFGLEQIHLLLILETVGLALTTILFAILVFLEERDWFSVVFAVAFYDALCISIAIIIAALVY